MNLFLCYASQDRAQVEPIRQALAAEGHDIFFDREDLPPGEAFDSRIRSAIERCDLFIVFLSPDTVDAGSYTLNEVHMAQKTWANPSGRVLPVILRPVPMTEIPAYLKSVTLLETQGNLAAAVTDAVHRLARTRTRRVLFAGAAGIGVVAVAAAALWFARGGDPGLTGRDGAPAIMIPAGKVIVGDDFTSPIRELYVDAFYIDTFEVTVARYAKFLEATGSLKPPELWEEVDVERNGGLPVVGVTWSDADSYCRWVGRRLPTDAEWERATRGDDGRQYTWGDEIPTAERANFGKDYELPAYKGGLMPVGGRASGVSPFGVHDLTGNAYEWVADWFTDSFPVDDVRNPKGPPTGEKKVLRGGGWYDSTDRLHAGRRVNSDPEQRSDDVGFRCARDVTPL